MSADTRVLTLRHCVAELSIRVLGRPVVWGRFPARRGWLDLGEDGDEPVLEVELGSKSLRTNIPLLRMTLTGERARCVSEFREIRFIRSGPGEVVLHARGVLRRLHVELAAEFRAA
ncbi:hypothetical protein [Amycolatopsis anabasis]|uniref:hypothetical protein n=1 Tax=Amycolatopsis anabasis TaxID=1840409 RepID=UPI001FE800AD|nr:hypothetical protein [Amycolatopsis anabasis]